ncbi:hypothetical protein, partial [Pseudoxanthomonas sp.]|uniref:hypothetical protein n=1 Tax=Pseudoxanthomonas sp. TaxID=1871049 RepID=UPI002FDFD57F
MALLASCGGSGSGRYADYEDMQDYPEDDSDAREGAAEEARQEVFSSRGADSNGVGAETSSVDAFSVEDAGNYVCTKDCSGHEAGFSWGQDQDATSASDCTGNFSSFIEGCEAFVQARQEQADRLAQDAAEEAAQDAYDNYESDRGEEGSTPKSRTVVKELGTSDR